jgi:hypothetical protein
VSEVATYRDPSPEAERRRHQAREAKRKRQREQLRERRRNHLISEVEHLIGTDHTESIAQRLGYSSGNALGKALSGYGRGDLARKFYKRRAT